MKKYLSLATSWEPLKETNVSYHQHNVVIQFSMMILLVATVSQDTPVKWPRLI